MVNCFLIMVFLPIETNKNILHLFYVLYRINCNWCLCLPFTISEEDISRKLYDNAGHAQIIRMFS